MGTEITTYKDKWQAMAARDSERLKASSGGKTIGTAGGILKLDDVEIPGNALCAVILDAAYVNSFYVNGWSPGDSVAPQCFAMSHEQSELAPHPSMEGEDYFEPQHDKCQGCPQNEFGTARVGKGKACGNRIRLALVDAGWFEKVKGTRNEWSAEIIEDEGHYKTKELVYLNVPPTSIKAYQKYVKKCADDYGRPTSGLITRIDIEPMGTGGFGLAFETLEQFPDEYFPTLNARYEEAREAVIKPYTPPDPEQLAAKQVKTASRLKGLRKS